MQTAQMSVGGNENRSRFCASGSRILGGSGGGSGGFAKALAKIAHRVNSRGMSAVRWVMEQGLFGASGCSGDPIVSGDAFVIDSAALAGVMNAHSVADMGLGCVRDPRPAPPHCGTCSNACPCVGGRCVCLSPRMCLGWSCGADGGVE